MEELLDIDATFRAFSSTKIDKKKFKRSTEWNGYEEEYEMKKNPDE